MVEGVKCVLVVVWRDVTKDFLLKRNKPEYCSEKREREKCMYFL